MLNILLRKAIILVTKCVVRPGFIITVIALSAMLSFQSLFSSCVFCSSQKKLESTGNATPSYRQSEIIIVEDSTTYEAFDGGTLDRDPEIIRYVKPEYPWIARAAGIEGTALIKVTINKEGYVIDAKILKSNISPRMEDSLLRAARHYIYKPGVRNSHPVVSIATHLIRFTLNDDVIPIRIG